MVTRAALTVVLVLVLVAGCSSIAQQTKSSADAMCASSCKNVPADSQGDCIARCTK